jgi:hypothetical protein
MEYVKLFESLVKIISLPMLVYFFIKNWDDVKRLTKNFDLLEPKHLFFGVVFAIIIWI